MHGVFICSFDIVEGCRPPHNGGQPTTAVKSVESSASNSYNELSPTAEGMYTYICNTYWADIQTCIISSIYPYRIHFKHIWLSSRMQDCTRLF